MDFGVDDAGAHGVDADALGRHFAAEADGEDIDGALAGGIFDTQCRARRGSAAADDRLTMTPPEPPCFVDMRFTASRAQRKEPRMLMSKMRCERSGSSRRAGSGGP